MKFTVQKWDEDSSQYGERFCPYDLPENQVADDLDDAVEKAMFAWEDGGVACERIGDDRFATADGDEYRVHLS